MNLLEQIRANLRAKLDQRSAHQAAIDAVTAAAEERGEGTLTEEETAEFTEARDAIVAIDAETTELRAREAELVAAEEARANADALATRLGAAPTPVDVRNVRQPDLYNAGGEHSFFSDAYRAQFSNDRAAADRLARHSQFEAESRDASVASFGALIPPQYLVNEYAQIARAGRPYSNSIMSLPLPARGTTFNIPRGTTGTTAAAQASEGDSVSETDFDETTLAVSVRTIAGAQDISRQALERGEGVDAIIYADLAAAYAVALDTANLTSLLALSGTEAVTYTDASPTVAELWPKLADAIQRVNSLRFAPATAIYMHPRRWGWMTAPVDSTGRPLFAANGAVQNPFAIGKAAEYGQVVGEIQGLPVITDANITTAAGSGTDEDVIIIARAADHMLWEEGDGTPQELRFDQPQGKKLTVEVAVYGYSAYTAGRYPKATAKIGGTGLVAPTF